MIKRFVWSALLVWVAGLGQAAADPPPLPATPVAVDALLYARPFELKQGFAYDWRKERPSISRGVLLVLQVDPRLVYPRQRAEPVLYVGDQTAMRLNVGYPSGIVVALVPGDAPLASEGTLVWFGTPRLPESVTEETIAAERALAHEAKISPLAGPQIARALALGGAPVSRQSLNALLSDAATLIKRYAPDEAERAAALSTQGE